MKGRGQNTSTRHGTKGRKRKRREGGEEEEEEVLKSR
jgi:hypothetical protein